MPRIVRESIASSLGSTACTGHLGLSAIKAALARAKLKFRRKAKSRSFRSLLKERDSATQYNSLNSTIEDCLAVETEFAATESASGHQCKADLFECCEVKQGVPLRIALLLSGGVDSSLALHILRKAGHHITAFYLKIWFQEDFRNFWSSCPWEEDLLICKQVCELEGVALEIVPLTEAYWQTVVTKSIAEIKKGKTPNPDILCNSRVKFGAFLEWLQTTHGSKFDRVASGHYAHLRRENECSDKQVQLLLTPDANKDQTYFLAGLTQQQLASVMFPLGTLTKGEVRKMAVMAGLPNQARRDSQGICFLGKVKFDQFVQQHMGVWPGPLIDEETNEVVGFHKGFWFYTPGQRKGIFLSGGPWYVSRKNCQKNAVYISRQYYLPDKQRNYFQCKDFNWISGHPPSTTSLQCKVRHGPQMYQCKFLLDETQSTAIVHLAESDQGLAPGQYAVFYDENLCLGLGVISASEA